MTLLKLLILEDDPDDTEFEVEILEEAGYVCQWERVETRADFLQRLEHGDYDLILADYRLPTFDGLEALELFRQQRVDIPFILVSGMLGEEIAVESLKAGATDYILKHDLSRLVPAVRRALREYEELRRRRAAEKELLLLQQAVASAGNGIVLTDATQPGNPVVYVNLAFEKMTGYPTEEVLGRGCHFLYGDDYNQPGLIEIRAALKENRPTRAILRNYRRDGTLFWNDLFITPIRDKNGDVTHFVGIQNDVTERKQIEDQMRQQERLAAVGQLAAGIAHDFSNILSGINLYAEMLQMVPELPIHAQEYLHTVIRQTNRANNLIQQILDFSRRAVLERRPVNLRRLLQESIMFLERTIPENIRIRLAYDTNECLIYADPTRIQQAFMNLAVNARDAMPAGGDLTIRLTEYHLLPGQSPPLPEMAPGDWVKVTLSDSGVGISPEIQAHLFEPFFSTKGPGQGTGLGLAQVYGIVKQHEGHIGVSSQPGIGTTFTLYIPQLSLDEPVIHSVDEADLPSGQQELILIVEDDQTTREALAQSLEVLNFRSLTAENGRQALAILEEQSENIDLILSDVVMPEMSGGGLLRAIKEKGWSIAIVMMSGYVLEDEVEELRSLGMVDWLPKPIKLDSLAQTIHRVLVLSR